MSEQCTYAEKDIRCTDAGVGRTGPKASHWLCQKHLQNLNRALSDYASSGDAADGRRVVGMIVRAGGGAKAMADNMAPSINAGVAAILALTKPRP